MLPERKTAVTEVTAVKHFQVDGRGVTLITPRFFTMFKVF